MKEIVHLTPSEEPKLVHTLLDISEEMILSGAEVSRVEDTVCRIGKAFGAVRVNIFAITSFVLLTITDESGRDFTQSKRIKKPAGVDFTRLEKLNKISRKCCYEGMTLEEVDEKIKELRFVSPGERKYYRNYLGCIIIGFGFTLFFGGGLIDGIVAAFVGLIMCVTQLKFEEYFPNRVVYNLFCGFVTGVAICLAAKAIPILHADKIMIGDIMIQIPGVAITISFRDIIVGETLSGILRLIESLFWAAALAGGYMLAIFLMGGVS